MPVDPRRILYSDDHLLAVNKRSSELVVRGKGALGKLPLLDFLRKDYPGIRPLHRLDFETSGVVLFARTKASFEKCMEDGFDSWKKTYSALVMGVLDRRTGAIRFPLTARSGGKPVPAETLYTVLERFANSTYVEVEMVTGRHHQIRQHLAKIGHPLVLDAIYGHKKFNSLFTREFGCRKFFLHASRLSLKHPITGEHLVIEAPITDLFESILKLLRSLR